jgi:TRAP-type transport system small permease protein
VKKYIAFIPEFIGSICIIGIAFLTFIEIVFRNIGFSIFSVTGEISRIFFIWASFIGAAICLKKLKHFSFDILIKRLSKINILRISLINNLLILLFSGILIVEGLRGTIQGLSQQLQALGVNFGLMYSAIPTCGFLMFVYEIKNLIKNLREYKECKEE